jgi:CBS domain containing-hemolysin-like protein
VLQRAYTGAENSREVRMDGIEVVDIAHAIELALAPVFLLSGIWVFLGVLTSRLARIVDRARSMEKELRLAEAHDPERLRRHLRALATRARYINIAITLGTLAALFVAIVVALLFSSTFIPLNLAPPLALLFVLAMCLLVAAFVSFLIEVRVAIAVLRIGDV